MELHHKSHEHSLFFVEGNSETHELVRCWGCEDEICGARYSCFTCNFHLHKSCTELPLRLEDHPFHPQHPLSLLPEFPCKGGYICDACDKRGNGFVYHCPLCHFDLHTMCALSVDQKGSIVSERNGGKDYFRYGAYQHLLMLREEQSTSLDIDDSDCFVCSESISAPFFFCSKSRCRFRLHKFCADLPHQIRDNSFHPQHPLFLTLECLEHCPICGQQIHGSAYVCIPCDFFIHPRCAFSNSIDNIKRMGEKRIQHFAHRHLLTLLQDRGEWECIAEPTPLCSLCHEEVVSFPSYWCDSCPFILHKSCAELPTQIKSHLHPAHFLFLFARPPGGNSITYCDFCDAEISYLNYRCLQCGFILHVDCFLSLQGTDKLNDHKHCFIKLKTFQKLSCQTCGEEGYFSPWHCSSCHIMVHKQCADLPRFLRLESHVHFLKFTYYLSLVLKCDEVGCQLCYTKVNVDYAAYYCSECNYVAHLDCASEIGVPILEEENLDISIITNSDTTSSQDEDNKSLIQHFPHQHELALIEQDPEDHKYCEGCVRLIFPPFYSCKQCNFYLHKRCGESPRMKKHPFHPHLLTLNPVEGSLNCHECNQEYNGFIYSCQSQGCDFNLDLQCADIFPEGLQHPCHEHTLFFPYTRENERCKGCGWDREHILVCKECDYVLGYCCLRIPHVAKHRYDNHLLNLTYKKEDESGEYYCDICENVRNSENWFYWCSECEFSAHIKCVIGDYPHIKCGTTWKRDFHDHPLTLVEKCQRRTPPLCSSCGKRCYSKVKQCCQCNLHFHFTRSCCTL